MFLIFFDVAVKKFTQFGSTALFTAVVNGQADCLRLLIDSGADKDATDNVRRFIVNGSMHIFPYLHTSNETGVFYAQFMLRVPIV